MAHITKYNFSLKNNLNLCSYKDVINLKIRSDKDLYYSYIENIKKQVKNFNLLKD